MRVDFVLRSFTRSIAAGALLCVAAASTVSFLLSPRAAQAGEGTPPQYRCGKTFVAAASVWTDGADSLTAYVRIHSAHFLSLVQTGANNCPPPPHSLQITGTINCIAGPSPVNAGPFVITPGFSEIGPMIIAIVGQFDYCGGGTLDFVVTLSDGTQLKRTVTASSPPFGPQAAAAGPRQASSLAKTAGTSPRLEVVRSGPALLRVHPGDGASTMFEVRNNDLTESFTGTFRLTAENVAGMPEVPVGTNNRSFGAFALADESGFDTPSIALSGPALGNYCDLPPFPSQQGPVQFEEPISLPPGETAQFTCDGRTYSLCPKGTMAQIGVDVYGTFSKGDETATGSFAFLAVDETVTPAFSCPGGGRAVSYLSGTNPSGPAVGIAGDASATGNEAWQINIGAVRANMVYLANGVPPSSGTFNFSGPTAFVNGLMGRYVSEISFITPRTPDTATITFVVPFDVLPASTSPHPVSAKIVSVNHVPGVPTKSANLYPIISGRVHVKSLNGIGDAILDFQHQLSGVGVVDGTFALEAMENQSVSVVQNSDTRYTVTTTWTKLAGSMAGSTGGATAASLYVGFSVTNDIRGFATPAAPFVSVGDAPVVEGAPRVVALPNPASHGATIRLSGPGAAAANASIALFDAAGRLVREIAVLDGREARWDLTDAHGARVSPGVYFLRAQSARDVIAKGRLHIVR